MPAIAEGCWLHLTLMLAPGVAHNNTAVQNAGTLIGGDVCSSQECIKFLTEGNIHQGCWSWGWERCQDCRE